MMLKRLKSFLYQGLLLTLVLVLAGYFLFTGALKKYYLDIFPFLILFIFCFTVAIHAILLRAGWKEQKNFVPRYLMVSGIKILVYLFFLILYMILKPENAVSFVLTFLALYLIYTFFEVFSILVVLKKNQMD